MAFSLLLHVAAHMFFLEISEHSVLLHALVCIYYSRAELPLTMFLALVNAK
jgi:hypothetical protein